MDEKEEKEQPRTGTFTEAIHYKENLEEEFVGYCKDNQYEYSQPLLLIPGEDDPSVTFTSATINSWKEYLTGKKDLPSPGLFTIQPCLRTQNLASIYDVKKMPKFGSFFVMGGIIAPPERRDDIYQEAISFLTSKMGVAEKEITVHISSSQPEISECIEHGPNLDVKTDEINYYQWKYGIEGVRGEGLTISVLNKELEERQEIGNVVVIKRNDKAVAVEWGFGMETTTARLLSLPHPIAASQATCSLGEKVVSSPAGVRLADSIMAIAALFANGVTFEHSQRNVTRVLQKYTRGTAYLASLLKIEPSEIIQTVRVAANSIKEGCKIVDKDIKQLSDYLVRTRERHNRFITSAIDFLSNPIYHDSPERLAKTLKKSARQSGLNNPEVIWGIIYYNQHLFSKEQYINIKNVFQPEQNNA